MGTLLLAAAKFQLNLSFIGAFFFSMTPREVNLDAELRLEEIEELKLEIEKLEKKEKIKPQRQQK